MSRKLILRRKFYRTFRTIFRKLYFKLKKIGFIRRFMHRQLKKKRVRKLIRKSVVRTTKMEAQYSGSRISKKVKRN